jgi:hypothetical protein
MEVNPHSSQGTNQAPTRDVVGRFWPAAGQNPSLADAASRSYRL